MCPAERESEPTSSRSECREQIVPNTAASTKWFLCLLTSTLGCHGWVQAGTDLADLGTNRRDSRARLAIRERIETLPCGREETAMSIVVEMNVRERFEQLKNDWKEQSHYRRKSGPRGNWRQCTRRGECLAAVGPGKARPRKWLNHSDADRQTTTGAPGPLDMSHNCVAWAAGDTKHWWQPGVLLSGQGRPPQIGCFRSSMHSPVVPL